MPLQTVEFTEDFTLFAANTLSPVTGAEYPVSIPGRSAPAKPLLTRFDAGAEISLLSASTAKAWGGTMLEGSATLLGAGGGTFQAQPGFLPTLTIGKTQLHNVAVYVTAVENLYFAPLKSEPMTSPKDLEPPQGYAGHAISPRLLRYPLPTKPVLVPTFALDQ